MPVGIYFPINGLIFGMCCGLWFWRRRIHQRKYWEHVFFSLQMAKQFLCWKRLMVLLDQLTMPW